MTTTNIVSLLVLTKRCCGGSGYGKAAKIYKRLEDLGVQCGMASTIFNPESEIAKKYHIRKRHCPRLIIDSIGLSIALNELDNEVVFNGIIERVVGSDYKSKIVKKEIENADNKGLPKPTEGNIDSTGSG